MKVSVFIMLVGMLAAGFIAANSQLHGTKGFFWGLAAGLIAATGGGATGMPRKKKSGAK